jgi:putative transport protein
LDSISNIFRAHVELAIFLTLMLGFLLGKIRIGNFKVGVMLGCLIAGVIVGQMNISIPAVTKIIFFDLFLFATGYKVGPQFFYGLKKDALPQLALTVVICVTCLFTAYFASKLMGYDVGTACGLLAGAFTESTVIGTASDAIQRLQLSEAEKMKLINNIPVAYAVTYLTGTISLVWFLSSGATKLIGVNLRKEAEKALSLLHSGNGHETSMRSAYDEWLIRAFKLTDENWCTISIRDFEGKIPGARIIIERVRKNGSVVEPTPSLMLEKDDVVVIAARQTVMLNKIVDLGIELHDKELLDFPLTTVDVVISKKEVADKTLGELADKYGQGIMLKKIVRAGHEIPFEAGTVVRMGDALTVFGRKTDVDRVAKVLGFEKFLSTDTDIIAVATGIVLGGFIGMLTLDVGGIALTLSISGGALLVGLICGWLHSKTPSFGRIPDAALWIFDTLGLATFLAIVGIGAGPTFISGLERTGFALVLVGLIVAMVPHIIGLLFGYFVLRMKPLILLGAQCGAGTNTTALKAIQDASGSKVPVLGYTIPYALGNILLTAWGPVMVSMMIG